MGTAIASARKPAARLSPASKRKRNSLRCGIAGRFYQRIPLVSFLGEDNPPESRSIRNTLGTKLRAPIAHSCSTARATISWQY